MFHKLPIQRWIIYMTFDTCVFNIVIKTLLGVLFKIIYFILSSLERLPVCETRRFDSFSFDAIAFTCV